RAQDAVAVERRAGDDAGAHLVHQVEHLLLVRPRRGLDAVKAERPGGAAAALVERRDETLARSNPVTLLLIHCHVDVLSSGGGSGAVIPHPVMIPRATTGGLRRPSPGGHWGRDAL